MSWELISNQAYEGQPPRLLEPACHDGSPFLTIRCSCGGESHVHETQTGPVPLDAEIGMRCPACGKPQAIPAAMIAAAFTDLRADGWIR